MTFKKEKTYDRETERELGTEHFRSHDTERCDVKNCSKLSSISANDDFLQTVCH